MAISCATFASRATRNIRAVDVKPFDEWYQRFDDVDNRRLDLADLAPPRRTDGARYVYNLAADMGGMGFIENNKAACMLSVLTSTHLLMAARECGVERYFYASSACVYAAEHQTVADVTALQRGGRLPGDARRRLRVGEAVHGADGRHFREDFGMATRVARYHNVYGPHGTYAGGREKAPAAICRKVIEAKLSGSDTIEIWGDGEQTRSFMYIDDCVYGTQLLTASDVTEPINIGSDQLVTINTWLFMSSTGSVGLAIWSQKLKVKSQKRLLLQ